MVIRFRAKDGTSVISEAAYLEVEEVEKAEAHEGKWVFKDYETD